MIPTCLLNRWLSICSLSYWLILQPQAKGWFLMIGARSGPPRDLQPDQSHGFLQSASQHHNITASQHHPITAITHLHGIIVYETVFPFAKRDQIPSQNTKFSCTARTLNSPFTSQADMAREQKKGYQAADVLHGLHFHHRSTSLLFDNAHQCIPRTLATRAAYMYIYR